MCVSPGLSERLSQRVMYWQEFSVRAVRKKRFPFLILPVPLPVWFDHYGESVTTVKDEDGEWERKEIDEEAGSSIRKELAK